MSQFVDVFPDLVRVYGNNGEKKGNHSAGLQFFIAKKKAKLLGLEVGAYYQLLRLESGAFRLLPIDLEVRPLGNGHIPKDAWHALPTLVHCKNNGDGPKGGAGYRIYVPRKVAEHYGLRPGLFFQVTQNGSGAELLPVEIVLKIRGGPRTDDGLRLDGRKILKGAVPDAAARSLQAAKEAVDGGS